MDVDYTHYGWCAFKLSYNESGNIAMPREVGEKSSSFPNKEARSLCWDARDKFWECTDAGGTTESCAELRKMYEDSCPSTWVKHFDRKKNYLEFKEKMKVGYDPIEENKK
ncbi:unnamed protein product [Meganyctiphanes norvegica]|uniref:Cytochrome c oxidase assembly factor 6 homolog n=1 Tax=Meganyctiphanes norvegica TaxID=48144 RepID=A0AAV2R6T3_MEGNR